MAPRQSLSAVAKTIESRLNERLAALEQAIERRDIAQSHVNALRAEINALENAYELVKPQPRTRTKRMDVTNG